MTFPLNVYALAFVSALLTSLLSLPLWRAWCRRVGHVDDPGHRKIHAEPIPLAGGLAVATGLFLPLIVGAIVLASGSWNPPVSPHEIAQIDSHSNAAPSAKTILETVDASTIHALQHGMTRRAVQMAAILIGALAMVILGWIDDRHELRPGPKFLGQFLVAALVAAAGVRITLFVPNILFSYAITIVWILTLINALNFMDNMNGLCAGLGAIGAWFFALIAATHGQYLVTIIALLTAGSLCGFLPYNYPKASVFLGDAGSHLVGYLLAVLAILPHFYSHDHPHVLAVLTPLLILAVPLGDLVCVVIIRWRIGQPFYVGDNNHLSHRLVRRGLTKPKAVLIIWLLAVVTGSLAFGL